jgi:maltose alpha-D-glucosyltransferase/alpha-amylase
MVVNHTSDQHPWFQAARRAPRGSAVRNMYVWSDTDEKYADARIIFTDTETSNWAWDPVGGQYYWHRFFSHQPDLNFESPRVRRAVLNIMKFWFEAGVDGLRLDAIPYLCEREGTNCENLPETHAIIREWRTFVDEHYPGRILLAEANQWPSDVIAYFGRGDQCHMAFHFPLMPRMFMALRQEDRHPIVDILSQTPLIPASCQWGVFLRNHDELTLEMVTDEERDYMYSAYAADPKMRLNVGIRRRLAPLMDNNRRAIELLHSLLFSMPGTPLLYYGDEMGMGDNYWLGDRDGVRTPMQWTADRNAGFSTADPGRLYAPLILDPLYGYQAVNVEAQERSASSTLNWIRRMIGLRRQRQRVFGQGTMEMLHPSNRAVLAYVRRYEDEVMLVVANLSRFVQPLELDLSEFAGAVPFEVIGGNAFPVIGEQPYFLSLGPHGFYWFDLRPQPDPVVVSGEPGSEEPVAAIQVGGDWEELFEGQALRSLEREVLPAVLPLQRWFGGKDREVESMRITDTVALLHGSAPVWIAFVEVTFAAPRGGTATSMTYALPLAVAAGRAARQVIETTPAAVLTRVEGPRGRGVLYDAIASDDACLKLLDVVYNGQAFSSVRGELRASATPALGPLHDAMDERPGVERSTTEQSNSSIRIGGHVMLKLLRRVEPGPHPEIEVGRHFARVGFERAPHFAGAIEYASAGGEPAAVAVLQELVWNQADGWTYTLGEVARYLEEAEEEAPPTPGGPLVEAPGYAEAARTLGMRTAEMHLALADARGDADFEPEPLGPSDLDAILGRIEERLKALVPSLQRLQPELPPAQAAEVDVVVAGARRIRARLRQYVGQPGRADKIRCHGDYHLGQVLWARQDFTIIDFEGEVGLPLDERRQKASVLTDVAGMIRSFQYAAAVGVREQAARLPAEAEVTSRLEPLATHWEQRSTAAFLEGYVETLGESSLLPPVEQLPKWLDLHLLDKALHELEYELGHRPDWLPVPLSAVAALLARLQ